MTSPKPSPKPSPKSSPKPSPKPTATTYRILAMGGLALVFLAHPDRTSSMTIAMTVLVVVGLVVLYLPRFLGSGLFLVVLAFIELVSAQRAPMFRRMQPTFDLYEMLLAAGTLLYVGSLHRLHSLVLTAATHDPRLAEKPPWPLPSRALPNRALPPRPLPPQSRPESALRAEEIVLWLVTAPLCVLGAELLRRGLNRPTPLDELMTSWRIGHVVIAVWLLTVGVLFFWTVFDYWRRTNMRPDLARMMLEDMTWRETRRDQGRMGRWLAWRRRKAGPGS